MTGWTQQWNNGLKDMTRIYMDRQEKHSYHGMTDVSVALDNV
jgi:hypothetical protein